MNMGCVSGQEHPPPAVGRCLERAVGPGRHEMDRGERHVRIGHAPQHRLHLLERDRIRAVWTTLPMTLQAKTGVSRLTAGTTYYFRVQAVTRTGAENWSQITHASGEVVGTSARRAFRGTPRCSGDLLDVGRIDESAARRSLVAVRHEDGVARSELDVARSGLDVAGTAQRGASFELRVGRRAERHACSKERHASRGERADRSDQRGLSECGEARKSLVEAQSERGAERKSLVEALCERREARSFGRAAQSASLATHSFEGEARTSNGEPSLVAPKGTVGSPCDTQLGASGTQVEICAALPCTCGTLPASCGTHVTRSVSVVLACDTQVTRTVSVVEACATVSTARDVLRRPCVTQGKASAVPFEERATLSADGDMLGENCEHLAGLAPGVEVTARAGGVEPWCTASPTE